MPQLRDEDGEFTESVSDCDIVEFFDGGERNFYGSAEVAEAFGLDRSHAHRRLNALAERGEIERVEIGHRSVVWRRSREVVVLSDEDDGVSAVDPRTETTGWGETRPEALRTLAAAIERNEACADPVEDIGTFVRDELGVESDGFEEWL